MFTLILRLSSAVHAYLHFYMPTNRLIAWLRTPRGLRWAVPIALAATVGYLLAGLACASVTARFGALNVLVLMFFWNAIKFAWASVLVPIWWFSDRMTKAAVTTNDAPADETCC
jgi:hypothetical protein